MGLVRRFGATVLALLALISLPTSSSAQIRLRWNNCMGVGISAFNKNYACDGSLSGFPLRAILSFVAPADLPAFVGMRAVMDVSTDTPTLPDWWRLGVGECREGSFNFPASLSGVGNSTCLNPWSGAITDGGYSWFSENKGDDPQHPTSWPGHARALLAFARDTGTQLMSGNHYIAGVWTLDTPHDSGPGECTGCEQGVCIVLDTIELSQLAGTPPQDVYVLNATDINWWITWQGGIIGVRCDGASTPARNRTWGSVKALYR